MTAPGRLRQRGMVLVGTALAAVVEMLPGVPGPALSLAGLWLLLGAPTAVWYGTAAKAASTRDGAAMLALGFAVVTDIVVALLVNTLLPLFGADRPLTRVALASAAATAVILIGAFAPERPRPEPGRPGAGARGAVPVGLLSVVALTLSVAGPIRLNNGFSSAVSTAALVAVAALLVLLVVRRARYSVPVVAGGLYAASLGLLLLVSLRGWSITGHDIQREYEYFQLTLGGSRWNVSAYSNPYNACLSITLLPVSFVRLTAVPGVYVFKVLLPALFAVTPLLVHRAVRNVAPQLVALLSAVFFVSFPTFFTDMPYLGRQEIAFLLLGCAMVVVTDGGRSLRSRRTAFAALLAGVALSHYSTTYVLVVVLATAFVCDLAWRLPGRRRRDRKRRRDRVGGSTSFVTWWLVVLPAALALLWAIPITHTSGQLQSSLADAYQAAVHLGRGTASHAGDPARQLLDYRAQTLTESAAGRARGDYLPLTKVDAYPVTPVSPQDLPLTSAGKAVQRALPVAGLNGAVRALASVAFLALLLLGVVVSLGGRRRRFRPARDQVTLTVGALAVVGLFVALPQLSADYSVQRAYQQGLFFFAPFVAAGALSVIGRAGRRTVPVACALMTALLLDLTGVVPKLLGGYPAQLQLSNAGPYYDVYYPTPAERQAAYWLNQLVAEQARQSGGKEPVVQTDSFTFNREQTLLTGPVVGDVFPTVLNRHAYVLLGATTTRQGEVTIFFQGELVTYRYPMGLLGGTKNEIYSSEGAEVYR
ncbi:DUF2206 domain-containing protein [Streptacidiphilus rugosus]|uniref:DUF2206 domain-containing protein n=1 Tax=Streptacidiphilus rugosus TaxID=405783 RepID=UPI00055C3E9D|nr:DUF2206 domain-containing protein [Streptacidiphilus rugosus]